ncbi:unnamed protein product, partial [Urochloa humidicola]
RSAAGREHDADAAIAVGHVAEHQDADADAVLAVETKNHRCLRRRPRSRTTPSNELELPRHRRPRARGAEPSPGVTPPPYCDLAAADVHAYNLFDVLIERTASTGLPTQHQAVSPSTSPCAEFLADEPSTRATTRRMTSTSTMPEWISTTSTTTVIKTDLTQEMRSRTTTSSTTGLKTRCSTFAQVGLRAWSSQLPQMTYRRMFIFCMIQS